MTPASRSFLPARILIAGAVACLCFSQPGVFAQSQKPPRAKRTPEPTPVPVTATLADVKPGQHAYTFEAQIGRRKARINYLLYVPKSYGQDPFAKYPLIVFMHGSREIGRDINKVRNAVLPARLETEDDFPAIVVSPQSQTFGWDASVPAVSELISEIESTLSIDQDRVYLTGLSMGAYGAWVLALQDKDRFAAIVSVVGGYFYSPKRLCPLADVPTWVFAGQKDRNVNPKESIAVVNALKGCGGDPKFTLYADANHDQSWQRAYADPELMKWLLDQRRPPSVG